MFFIRSILIPLCLLFALSFNFDAVEIDKLSAALLPLTSNNAPQDAPGAQSAIRISEIIITGNTTIGTQEILDSLTIKSNAIYSETKETIARKQIKALGIFKSVNSKSIIQNKQAKIIFHVEELPLVGDIVLKGNSLITTSAITKVMKSKPNKMLNLSHLRSDINAINELYKKNGYSHAKVYRVQNPEQSRDPLMIHISEGIINTIIITGNNITRDYVILRELDIVPGDPIKEVVLNENLRRVINLNYFSNLYPVVKPSKEKNTYDLEIHLEERENRGSLSFGGGYSPSGGFNIFSDVFWDNIGGTSQSILLKFSRGVGRVNNVSNNKVMYQFRYHNPWMWDNRKSLTFKTWRTSGNTASFSTIPISNTTSGFSLRDELRIGADIAIGIPKTYNLRFYHGLKYETITLNDSNSFYELYTYKFTTSYDTRDVYYNPSSGIYTTFAVEQSFKFKKYALPFTEFNIGLKRFIPTFKNQVVALRADYGYIYSNELDINRNKFRTQLYYIGGFDAVRGWSEYGAQNISGNKKAIYSVEYRFLISESFQIVMFADAGFVSFDTQSLLRQNNYLKGHGIGLRFNVPQLGPIRFDFGWKGLKPMVNNDFSIHFNIGHAF